MECTNAALVLAFARLSDIAIGSRKEVTFLAAHNTVIFCNTPKGSDFAPKSGSHSQDAGAAAEWMLAITD